MNFLKIKYCLSIAILCLSLLGTYSLFAGDSAHQIIRFYKLNSKDQQNRLVMREKKLKLAGCHNFSIAPRIYQLTQIGYKYCALYSQRNCKANSQIAGLWKGKKENLQFTQGGKWLFNQEHHRGVKAKSWYCE